MKNIFESIISIFLGTPEERAEKERIEKERAEKERAEKERAEKERAEKERLEEQSKLKEKEEKEWIEKQYNEYSHLLLFSDSLVSENSPVYLIRESENGNNIIKSSKTNLKTLYNQGWKLCDIDKTGKSAQLDSINCVMRIQKY